MTRPPPRAAGEGGGASPAPARAAGSRGHATFDGTDWTACRDCALHETRTRIVVHRGRLDADVVFVGEAPGRDEDLQGLPFVGRSGKLLDRWIETLGLTSWCITNVVRCRPPDNRPPSRTELDACGAKLEAFLARVRPRVVVALGRHARAALEARGIPHEHIHHPSYFVRGLAPWEPAVADLKRRLELRLGAP